jgi:hypothetical protein
MMIKEMLVVKSEGKRLSGDLGVDGRLKLRMDLYKSRVCVCVCVCVC